jgi:hypothetical protein
MMRQKAQGAMEYMMSYGWAILVVMVVGVAMWQLGVFDMQSTATTSTGFSVMKPLLATCQVINDSIWGTQNRRGFTCQFVNNAGANVEIRNINSTVGNKTCQWTRLSVKPTETSTTGYISTNCISSTSCASGGCWYPSGCPQGRLPIGKDFPFTIIVYNFNDDRPESPCHRVTRGQLYDLSLLFTYDIDVGGVVTTKTESGKITLQAQ